MTDRQAKEQTMNRMLRSGFSDFCVQISAIVNAGLSPVIIMDHSARTTGYPKGGRTLSEAWDTFLECQQRSTTVKLVGTMRTS